jgi:hypothetical protein
MSCCPTTYWCTADGPVGVEADEDGVYTPPDGATTGPYANLEDAGDACPLVVTCGSCAQPFTIPYPLVISFLNQTPDMGLANSYRLDPLTPTSPCGSVTACLGSTGSDIRQLRMGFSCSGDDLAIVIFFGNGLTHFAFDDGGTLEPGWSTAPDDGRLYTTASCADGFDPDQYVGRVLFAGVDEYVSGEADVYISRL